MRFDSECDCAPPMILLRPLLAHGCRVSFFGGLQHSSVSVCPALSRDFGVLAEEDEHTSSTPLFFLFDKENVKIQFCVPTTSYPLVSTKFLHKYVPGTYFLSQGKNPGGTVLGFVSSISLSSLLARSM